jgi:glutamate-1-semialdehyde 2,1-aminomutase
MLSDFSRSAEHMAACHSVIPGGAHTYAKGDDQYPVGMAPVIERGAGCRVWDLDGNEFVEYGMGLRSVTLGHNFRPVTEAVSRHLDLGVNFVRPHRMERLVAERLAEIIPSAEMVKFGLNGSDVTTAAVRLARGYTGRDMVAICADQPFFSTDDWFIGTTPMNAGIPIELRELTVTFRYNDLSSLAAIFETHPDRVAAVMLEAEGSDPPVPGYLAGIRRLCDRHGAVLILDEIITGFRWHMRGAQYVYDIDPDLCTFGKGMANGFPISALAGRRELMRLGGFVEDRDRVFLLSQTFGGEPWSLAAILATIKVYEHEDVTHQLHCIGAKLRSGFEAAVAAEGLGDHVQLSGRDCNLTYITRDTSGERSQEFRTIFLQELIRRGVLAPSFVVSFSHEQSALDRTFAALAGALPVYRRGLEEGPAAVLQNRPVRPALRRRG